MVSEVIAASIIRVIVLMMVSISEMLVYSYETTWCNIAGGLSFSSVVLLRKSLAEHKASQVMIIRSSSLH
jgi:hypothetical protein